MTELERLQRVYKFVVDQREKAEQALDELRYEHDITDVSVTPELRQIMNLFFYDGYKKALVDVHLKLRFPSPEDEEWYKQFMSGEETS